MRFSHILARIVLIVSVALAAMPARVHVEGSTPDDFCAIGKSAPTARAQSLRTTERHLDLALPSGRVAIAPQGFCTAYADGDPLSKRFASRSSELLRGPPQAI